MLELVQVSNDARISAAIDMHGTLGRVLLQISQTIGQPVDARDCRIWIVYPGRYSAKSDFHDLRQGKLSILHQCPADADRDSVAEHLRRAATP
jgi:hypothetical protein